MVGGLSILKLLPMIHSQDARAKLYNVYFSTVSPANVVLVHQNKQCNLTSLMMDRNLLSAFEYSA